MRRTTSVIQPGSLLAAGLCGAALALFVLDPAWAAPKKAALPEASEVLDDALRGPESPFDGTVSVRAGKGKTKKMAVRCARVPAGGNPSCRREFVDAKGASLLVFATDGSKEWVFDKKLNKVWEGPASGYPEDLKKAVRTHYRVSISTGARVAGRETWKLELKPRSGVGVGRRLWVDRDRRLVLKDESILPDGTVAARSRFSRVSFREDDDPAALRLEPAPGAVLVGRLTPEPAVLSKVREETGFEPRFPSWLPTGYVLEGVELIPHKDKKILHCRYSDGAHALSLFQFPPRSKLDLGTKDRREVRLASGTGFASWTEDGGVLGWSAGGTKLVLVALLGPEVLEHIAESVR
ncbi:MAG: hypothetical protein HY748_15995 [Elusimicrobia bacterium]|nr:hypothetical protein [Elusimicrobiota bacterium]